MRIYLAGKIDPEHGAWRDALLGTDYDYTAHVGRPRWVLRISEAQFYGRAGGDSARDCEMALHLAVREGSGAMSTGERIPWAQAQGMALQLCADLAPVAERIAIAGSIRRRQPDVGDIELVCVPRFVDLPDLFGDATQRLNLLDEYVAECLDLGRLAHRLDKNGRPANGARYKRLRYQGVALDLFCVVEPAQYGVILAIRTGPSDYSKQLATPRSQGGWLPNWLRVKDGALQRRDDGTILPTPEEADVYRVLDLPYVPPEQRGALVPA